MRKKNIKKQFKFYNQFNKKIVLVTGHTGFKGSWLTSWLVLLGAKVIGLSIDIQDFIRTGNSKKKLSYKDEKILSDACEALIGAVFVDRGYNYTKNFILRLWSNSLKKSNVTILDAKTKLQEYSLKCFKKLPLYRFISSKGPKHNPTFKISVSIHGTKQFFGVGNSKQKAEQNGAINLLKTINLN